MDWCFDREEAYGRWGNAAEIVHMEKLDYEGKKKHIKKLWQEDPEKYLEWKHRCIELGQLPDFFGTADNPIPIDESKL